MVEGGHGRDGLAVDGGDEHAKRAALCVAAEAGREAEGLEVRLPLDLHNLEQSLAAGRPRALIQMATGSGKTLLAAFVSYRLVKFADAKRVLFLVDRANLGRQTLMEFQGFTTPDDGRKFTELYNVQHLSSNVVDPVARVTISTIQKVYSILRGETDLDPELDEHSAYELAAEPVPVEYNPAVPPETYDGFVQGVCAQAFGRWVRADGRPPSWLNG